MIRTHRLGLALILLGGVVFGFGVAVLMATDSLFGISGWGVTCVGLLLILGGYWQVHSGQKERHTPLAVKEPSQYTDAAAEQAEQLASPQPTASIHTKSRLPLNQSNQPRIVAIGGGTGMPQLLRGLRAYTDEITAIVTVADDGGSSGRLRRQIGLLPPGDFRNNIAALSESEELMTRLFQYRFAGHRVFDDGSGEPVMTQSELAGHSFGNLFIATMAAVTGSFEEGLAESSRILSVRGRVLPSTLEQVNLCAEIRRLRSVDGEEQEEWLLVEGESQIPEAGGQIERVFLQPEEARAYPEAIRAILQADLIVAGPGSFFTSILPNLLVPAVRDAIIASKAPSIYICNVATQPGETDGYSVSDHMVQLRHHAGEAFTTVLANHNYDRDIELSGKSHWVPLPVDIVGERLIEEQTAKGPVRYRLFTGDLCEDARRWRHDADKLAARVMEIYQLLGREPSP